MTINQPTLDQAISGDSAALEAILTHTAKAITINARRAAAGSPQLYEQLTQQAPTIIWEALSRFDPNKSQLVTFIDATLARTFQELALEQRLGSFGISSTVYARYCNLVAAYNTEEERMANVKSYSLSIDAYYGVRSFVTGQPSLDDTARYHDDMADEQPSSDLHDSPAFAVQSSEPTAPPEASRMDTLDSLSMLALANLTDGELNVVRYFYGVDGAAEQTTNEIAEFMGITQSRVRTLKSQALQKLRNGATQ